MEMSDISTDIRSNDSEDEEVESVCKSGQAQLLQALLSDENGAARCMHKLGTLLQLAMTYEHEEIVNLLLDHACSNSTSFVFLKTLIDLVTPNPKFPYLLGERDLDDRISRLIDAGLNTSHLSQALRHSAQNDEATRALLRNGADVNLLGRRGHSGLYYFFRGSSCFGDNMDTYAIFRNHLRKLRLVGLPLSPANSRLFREIENKYEQDYLERYCLEHNDPELLELSQCREECDRLRRVKLAKAVSLHDVVFKDDNQLAVLVSNPEFQAVLLSRHFRAKYPMYGYLLKLQFRRGLLRKALLDAAQVSLQEMLMPGLPDYVSREILKFLLNEELVNLIKAKFVKQADGKKHFFR